ncbi:GDP-mannose transporter, partial [Clarias magur]
VCLCSERERGTVAEKVANKSFKDFGLLGMLSNRVILGIVLVFQTREMPCW